MKTAAAFAAASRLVASPTTANREPLRQFNYADVQLTGGPFAEQYDALHAHYLALSNDRLLKVYRQRAGLPAPGSDMGGWYDRDGFVPGHTLGQYISGLARFGASTGDAACHTKVHDLVEGFAASLGPNNQSMLRPESNLWICYTLDKHFAGLIDAATLSKIPGAKELLNRVLAGTQPLLPAHGHDRIAKKNPPYDETYVMPENLFTAADLTGNQAFRDLARKYLLDKELFDPLAHGDDPFPGQHAYSHAIALSSAAKAWQVLGDPKYKQALDHAFTLLTTQQQFASGGWGPNETFITPHRGELCNSLSSTVDHFETPCGAYAATKLARYLIRFTAAPTDTAHADNLERVLFNTILAVKPPDSDGDYPYYSTYSPVATKVFYGKKWPCCSGTLAQTVADYPLNLYFQSHDGLYVNLYAPSRLHFTHAGTSIDLTQETRYPAEDTTTLTLHQASAAVFTLYLRIPAWLTQSANIRLNDKPLAVPARPGTYAAIHRTWRASDRLELTLPQSFRTEPIDDLNRETVALMRGSVQYVALNPTPELSQERLALPSSLKQLAPQSFVENYFGNQVVFIPLHHIQNETYTTYFTKS
ncbi:MAG: glycoside hydrolase family 127 protein [Acidobacteriota bacterium]|nr:glycoside hydrolase family 127 protein [Acidobacteriota bacterium]